MSDLNIQLCPETGICSIVKADGTKVDMVPDEVADLRAAAGNPEAVRKALAEVDAAFAQGLSAAQIEQISAEVK